MAYIEELGVDVLWRGTEIEIRYREGTEPLRWTLGEEIRVLTALGLKRRIWRLGAGRLVRASDGSLVEVVELRRAEGE